MSHGWRQEIVSRYPSYETDLQSLSLLLMPPLHLLQLHIQVLVRLPELNTVLLTICDLRAQADRE